METNHKETNGKSSAICLYWPGAVNYAHLPFTTWQNGLNKYISGMTGDGLHAGAQYPLIQQTSRIKKNKKSVSLLFGSGCAVTDEVSVSVKPSLHTPTVPQVLTFIPTIEIEGRRNLASLLFLGGGER